MLPYRWFRYTLLVPTVARVHFLQTKTFGMHTNFYGVYLGYWYKKIGMSYLRVLGLECVL
jgi:hypothetical protein